MKTIAIAAFVAAGLTVPGLHAQTTAPTPLVASNERRPAPALTVPDARGHAVALETQRGKVVLLDFWATWCTGCKVEIPWYVEFDRKYRSRGLTSIGVALDDEGWPVVTPYLKAHPISYTILAATPAQMPAYTLTSLPVTMLIDRQGRIAATHVGVVEKADWESKIVRLLAER